MAVVVLTRTVQAQSSVFQTTLEAFAAIGLPVTFFSALFAFVRLVRGETPDRIDEGINHGVALGFLPGTVIGLVVIARAIWP